MINSIQHKEADVTLVDAIESLNTCVCRLNFIGDGSDCEVLTFKGKDGMGYLISDICEGLEAIVGRLGKIRTSDD